MKRPSNAELVALAPGMIAMCVLGPSDSDPSKLQLEVHLTPIGSARWSRRNEAGEQLRSGLLSDVRRYADAIRTLVVHTHPQAGGGTCAVLAVAPH